MNAPIDGNRLADVLRGSTLSAVAFLADFRHCTDTDAAQLLEAQGAGDLARVEQLAHRIEGASKVIGAGALAAACALLSAAARSGDLAALQRAVEAFLECKRALDIFLAAPEADASAPAAPVIASGAQQICAGLVFIVVEDHEFQRGVIMRLLRQLGALEVHGVGDGAAALDAARATQGPAILVLDLAMPALNGMEVMRISAHERLPVAVIMNSALGEDLLRWPLHTARSYGANVLGAVSKPLTAAKLAPLLADYRRGSPPVTPGRTPLQ